MITVLIIYWIATTIYGVYWLIKNPSTRAGDDPEYVNLFEIIAKILPAAILAWLFIPMALLIQIKFKRKRKVSEAGEVFAKQADMTITFEKKKHE